MPTLNLDSIPVQLKALPQWVNWRYETRDDKPTKVPYMPNGRRADVTNPKTWSLFTNCVEALSRFDSIGIVCASGLAGIDLDHCIDDAGHLSDFAQRVVNVMQPTPRLPHRAAGYALCAGASCPTEDGARTYSASR